MLRLAALLSALALPAHATCAADAMLVFDGSASMARIGGATQGVSRMTEARAALRRALPPVDGLRRLGLVTYGPGPEGSCESVRLRFAPRAHGSNDVLEVISSMRPLGRTPLTEAVARAADVLNGPGEVVLVTDGNETCDGVPCALGDALAARGGVTVHVIGFRMNDGPDPRRPGEITVLAGLPARCLADRTGGRFLTADTADELSGALAATLGCPLLGEATRHREAG